MASKQGDNYSIRIGGDASGTVVAGHDNRVEVNRATPPAESDAPRHSPSGNTPSDTSPAGAPPAPTPSQSNTASGHSTVFTVMNGTINVNHDGPRTPPEQ
ncbi:hypothetical protein [Allostreptomyces psammosilenae]|uniref:Uncharacterized protein n=1 Tax=Allostreptomyces psammosilenae TaxID=1892865 RepID=A0A852ZTP1_9ACTN|nr:hypothetical protein [Allostreptomyces psammosilenae]NYI05773.1 hypothetical protein [Allostreptomyces psammosilenae]